ncbi:MAG: hypothetical protein QOG03_1038 [Actinomycetota bacterium]|jgi:hypothetical protein|nr:hypothetical protein [Actinomycetota bacterium]
MAEETGGSCPLCGEAFDHHVSYRRHLSRVHDLQDEPGTRTTFRPAPPPAPVVNGRRIGKKPNLDALPDVWDPVDPNLARRLGRPTVEPAEVDEKKATKKASKKAAKKPKKAAHQP